MYKVLKRDGSTADFDLSKICKAIEKAFDATSKPYDESIINTLALKATAGFAAKIKDNKIGIEDIQDSVERTLADSGYGDVAKNYILYRESRRQVRTINDDIRSFGAELVSGGMGSMDDTTEFADPCQAMDVIHNQNASTGGGTVGAAILQESEAITKMFWESRYDQEIRHLCQVDGGCGEIYIHDMGFAGGYCAGWSLKDLIVKGLGGVRDKISSAPAKHLSTLCNQLVNFLGIMQNEWAGAQAVSSFDTYLAPFAKVDNLDYKQVKQAIQSFVYGVNVSSRWGCVPMTTKVLSEHGWKNASELKKGDRIYTWKNGNLELCPVNAVVIKPNESGKLHVYKARGYVQAVTPDHRVLCKKHNVDEYVIRHSDEIFDVRTPYYFPTKFHSSALMNDAKLTEAEAQMAAIIYCDGSIDMRGDSVHKISIYKSPERYGNDLISDLANELGLTFSSYTKTGGFGSTVNYYVFYGDSARKLCKLVGTTKKDIDDKFTQMDSYLSELFIKTWSKFDGNSDKFALQYDNDVVCEKLEHIALRAGYTTYHERQEVKHVNYLKIRQTENTAPSERGVIDYSSDVWCPNDDNGTAVFKDVDGSVFISGQCQAPFTNITLDWTVPEDMVNLPAIVGGKEMDFTYGDCKKEMDMINKAFLETMIEGDANGRGFQYPIPSYSITKDFDWSETENNRLLFEMAAKYGTPYFSNYINSDMKPSDVRSMCCRLRLDLRELRKQNGGNFGAGENTGSIGVVTINLPHIAYLAADEDAFFKELKHAMDVAARSLDTKRKVVTAYLNRENSAYPYTKAYLTAGFKNHFSTIGLVGMNEACLNAKWLGKDLTAPESLAWANKVLDFMRTNLSDYQEKYGNLFNLEATPAESTCYTLARMDRKNYPDIITAGSTGETPYYTNSSHLPVGKVGDLFDALDMEDPMQIKYTSGTVFHAFLGERLSDWKSAARLVRKIAENYKLPYFTLSPTYSVCEDHGYISGEVEKCPICGKQTEVYSRITGYYRPLKSWNSGKSQEFKDRKTFDGKGMTLSNCKVNQLNLNSIRDHAGFEESNSKINLTDDTPKDAAAEKLLLFITKTCPNCKVAKTLLAKNNVSYQMVDAEEDPDLCKKYGVMQAPTMVELKEGEPNKYVGVSNIIKFCNDIKH